MKTKILAIMAVAAMITACSDSDQQPTSSVGVKPATQMDTDPTPDTGTGGESQNNAADGTVNGAPGRPEVKP